MPYSQEMYYHFNREEWANFHHNNVEGIQIDKLTDVVSFNDQLTQQDVREVYGPLLHYIDLHMHNNSHFNQEKAEFMHLDQVDGATPFIIGISGSVAVGKSTVARVLHELLEKAYPSKDVSLMTTDGFLYPNEELERRGLYERKGFPESYDMAGLLNFMSKVKVGSEPVEYPVYSHEEYDIIPGEMYVMDNPDILIVEGINTFQLPQNQQIYVSDFFDFSIYVDADPLHIKEWYTERYLMYMDMAKDDPDNFFYPLTQWEPEQVKRYGDEVWYTVNLTNLIQNILPTKGRADLIIHKAENHHIDEIQVRKY